MPDTVRRALSMITPVRLRVDTNSTRLAHSLIANKRFVQTTFESNHAVLPDMEIWV